MKQPVFYNTMGRKLEPFEPLTEGQVRLYTCGPTVYNTVHIGNLRTFLFEDLLRRALRYLGYDVQQVMNLTDVDDKTIRGAQEQGVELDEFTAPHIQSFFEDLDTLGMERAEEYPRATEHVEQMISMIEQLVERGHAYEKDGSVWFRIGSDDDYGRLSGFDLDQVRQGERVASDEYEKDDVRDFVLWKGAKEGEPSWDSPWGPGRPGWHIECSAMSMEYLGESFDIHCGGVDNIFPHHENEIAQSECATGETFSRYWLHSEHLIVDGEKMSKSLGNFYTLRELLEKGVDPRALRYLFLSVHYRQKLNFTFDSLGAASAALKRLDELRFRLEHAQEQGPSRPAVQEACEELLERFGDALADDLNMSRALAELFGFLKRINRAIEDKQMGEGDAARAQGALAEVDTVLGVLDPAKWPAVGEAASGPSDEEIQSLVDQRTEARAAKDFATADELRARLDELGIILKDGPDGTVWRRG
ncbi:MAG: cysteine--tRNA ligase [Acidobacteriota bacterium]|nr:cysteine--tRNA ligase [Acidobacteriota bacterium]